MPKNAHEDSEYTSNPTQNELICINKLDSLSCSLCRLLQLNNLSCNNTQTDFFLQRRRNVHPQEHSLVLRRLPV